MTTPTKAEKFVGDNTNKGGVTTPTKVEIGSAVFVGDNINKGVRTISPEKVNYFSSGLSILIKANP